jgi:hypothetical protein
LGIFGKKEFPIKKQEELHSHSIQRVYGLHPLPVIAHLDVVEYLHPKHPITNILADWTDSSTFLRAFPAKALHDPRFPDDTFTVRQICLPFSSGMSIERKQAVLGTIL